MSDAGIMAAVKKLGNEIELLTPALASYRSALLASGQEKHRFTVTFYDDVKAFRQTRRIMTLGELAELINNTSAKKKSALPLLKFAEFGSKRSKEGSLRHNANMTVITGVEADYDGEEISFDEAVQILQRAGIRFLIYETSSSTPRKPRWRILCPTTQALDPALRKHLAAYLNELFDGRLAGETFTRSQAFYFGAVEGQPRPRLEVYDGKIH